MATILGTGKIVVLRHLHEEWRHAFGDPSIAHSGIGASRNGNATTSVIIE
jgi:hypothetical protein